MPAELPLVQQFLHDERTDVITYGPGWRFIATGSGDPFRNNGVTVNFDSLAQGSAFTFSFTSGGQVDEWVQLQGVLDYSVQAKIYLNNQLIAEYYEDGTYRPYGAIQYQDRGNFWQHNGDFAEPWLRFRPDSGLNVLQVVCLPTSGTSNRNIYFDGIGYNLRGVPKP